LAEEAECERIMHMIAGIRGGVAGLMAEVVEDHIRTHLVDPEKNPGAITQTQRISSSKWSTPI
jgi:DNA-binding FrmR family transcriptional regulator